MFPITHYNPNPGARKAYLTRNRVSNNVVAPPGFDPWTSRTPVPWPGRPSHRMSLPGQRFLAHLGVSVMTQSHLMHFLSSILLHSRRLGLIPEHETKLSVKFSTPSYLHRCGNKVINSRKDSLVARFAMVGFAWYAEGPGVEPGAGGDTKMSPRFWPLPSSSLKPLHRVRVNAFYVWFK